VCVQFAHDILVGMTLSDTPRGVQVLERSLKTEVASIEEIKVAVEDGPIAGVG
jgi:hypothetical protein